MSKNTTSVSIIMNCFNGERYLREAIDSIYAQTFDNWEIIFWDNCSNDQSALIAKSYDSKLKYFFANTTTSLGQARNLALKKAKGDYICFLDCDDIYLSNKLECQLLAMKLNKAVLSYSGWIKINEEGEEIDKYTLENEFNNQFESLLLKYKVNFQSLMIDHNYLLKNKIEFDENTSFSPDFNLVLKIAYDNPLLTISQPLVKYRVHQESMSNNKKKDKLIDFEYTIDHLIKIGAPEKFKNFHNTVLRAKYNILIIDLMEQKKYFKVVFLVLSYFISIIKFFFVSNLKL